jgi:hypothetical protein
MRETVQTPAGTRFVDELAPTPNVYETMLHVAARDLSGDALEARRAEVRAMAAAGGRELPGPNTDPREAQLYDQWNASGKMASTQGTDGLPAVLSRGQLEFWSSATKDAKPDPNIPSETLDAVKVWLQTAAGPAQAAELLTMAERSLPVAQALASYAAAAKRYADGRPKK